MKRDLNDARFSDDAGCCFTLVGRPFCYFRRYPSEPVTETPNVRSDNDDDDEDAPRRPIAIRLLQTACDELCP